MEGIKQLATAKRRAVLNLPFYSLGEEIWNAVSHGIGAGLSIAALVLLYGVYSQNSYTHLQFIGIQHFYDFALCDFHLISCAACDKRKKSFQILDHCTIFFMIAGTYTPMLLLCVKGITGWVMLGVVWAASVIGILLNAVDMKRYKKFSMACYICIGWSCVFIIKPLVSKFNYTSALFAGRRRRSLHHRRCHLC